MSAAMAEDHRHTMREIAQREQKPEYNLNSIHQNLESLGDPLIAVLKVAEARKKRETAEQQRNEANRRLQEQLAKRHDEEAQRDREAAEAEAAEQDANPPPEAPEEPGEPEATEAMCLHPPQPLPAVDLSPLGLPQSLGPEEAMAQLQELMATRSSWDAPEGESASPVLRVLFDIVAYGDNPYSSYEQLVRYYSEADPVDLGWVPQLPDFFTALTTLGYQPHRGQGGGGGGRKRSTGEGPAPQGAAAGGGGGDGGGGGGLGPRVHNLRGLLRLLTDLARLHQQGRLDAGFGNQGQAACKGLITALLRLLLDPALAPLLHCDACAALEGLLQPWDEPAWGRICDDAAAVAADLGPSHRAAYRVITAAQGLSDRLRTWQQCAAMQLLRKTLPQGMVGGSGPVGSHRGQVGVDLRQVRALMGQPNADTVKGLLEGLSRPRERGGAAAVDYWRLLTVLQCAHLVVWNTASAAEGGEVDELVRWVCAYLKAVEQRLRGQAATVMRIKVFLADVQTNYELLAPGVGE